MGGELYVEYEVFRRSIDYQDNILTKLDNSPKWNIRGEFDSQRLMSRR